MKTVLDVKGMKCGGCETTVQDAVRALAGVIAVQAKHKENKVEVEWEEGIAELALIRQAIAAKGFQVG
jgi:copper chaperone CopZ